MGKESPGLPKYFFSWGVVVGGKDMKAKWMLLGFSSVLLTFPGYCTAAQGCSALHHGEGMKLRWAGLLQVLKR